MSALCYSAIFDSIGRKEGRKEINSARVGAISDRHFGRNTCYTTL